MLLAQVFVFAGTRWVKPFIATIPRSATTPLSDQGDGHTVPVVGVSDQGDGHTVPVVGVSDHG